MHITAVEKKRFSEKFIKGSEDDCWNWAGAKKRKGYGAMKLSGDSVSAHRIAYFLSEGAIPEGLYVCHRCDNPACVNPSHLFLGTPLQNTQDMHSKGRQRYVGQKGRRNPRAELSEKQVKKIIGLIAKGHTNKAIAQRFGVSHSTVSLIRLGKSWSEIPRPDNPNFKPYRSLRSPAAKKAASLFLGDA